MVSFLCLAYFLFVVVWLFWLAGSSAIDCLESLVSELTYYVLSETLNPKHSLSDSCMCKTGLPSWIT